MISQEADNDKFQSFIDELDLIDLPVLGKRFTWLRSDGSAISRLDRFLISDASVNLWNPTAQWVGRRDVSDHCPIMLKGEILNWGPKPFRFNNCWLEHSEFLAPVENCWKGTSVDGWRVFAFKEQLRILNEGIKIWNRDVSGNLDNKIEKLVYDLNASNEVASSKNICEEEIRNKRQITSDLYEARLSRNSLLFQKSRVRWLREGDVNSSFLHSCVNF